MASTFADALGVAGLIIGFLSMAMSVLVSYFFYRKSLRERRPMYSVDTYSLIRGNTLGIPGVDVLYKGDKIENLSVSDFVFWNDGKQTITSADVREFDPLRIEATEQTTILDATLLEANYPPNQLSIHLNPDGSKAAIEFVDLDYLQGGVIRVVHTGISHSSLIMRGSVHGAREVELVGIVPTRRRWAETSYRLVIASSCAMVVVIESRYVNIADKLKFVSIFGISVFIVTFVILAFLTWWNGRSISKRERMRREFKIFRQRP